MARPKADFRINQQYAPTVVNRGAFFGVDVQAKGLVIIVETTDGEAYPMTPTWDGLGCVRSDVFARKPNKAITVKACMLYRNGKLVNQLTFQRPYFHVPHGHKFKVWFVHDVATVMEKGNDYARFRTYSLIKGSPQNLAKALNPSLSAAPTGGHLEWFEQHV